MRISYPILGFLITAKNFHHPVFASNLRRGKNGVGLSESQPAGNTHKRHDAKGKNLKEEDDDESTTTTKAVIGLANEATTTAATAAESAASPPSLPPTPPPSPETVTNLFEVEDKMMMSQRENHANDESYEVLKYLNLISRMEKGKALLSDIFQKNSTSKSMGSESYRLERSGKRSIVVFSAPTTLDLSEGKNNMYFKNFHYFLNHAIDCDKHSTVIVTTKVVADEYRLRIMKLNFDQCRGSQYSVELLERENKCYDMESMRTFLHATDTLKWDYFLYVNCGMIGPKWDGDHHWTDIFTSRLSETTKLVGVTINMSFHPHVQSFAMATDQVGIGIIKNSDAVYDCGVYNDQSMTEEQRWKIIDRYEIGMSRQIMNAGYTINSLIGALGDSFSINKDDINTIIERAQINSAAKPVFQSTDKNIWDSNTENFLLPYGDDIWSEHALLSTANGGIPSWSDFVFFKASREILLPAINDEVQYDDPSLVILKPFRNTSLPTYHEDPSRDICEEAKTNFRKVSKLSVIVTGYEHSGTTMLAQLIKSDPSLFGGFECGLLLSKEKLLNDIRKPFYDWLIWDMRNDLWGLNNESRDLVVHGARCDAEMYSRLHKYSPLFHRAPNNNSMILDKTPAYMDRLVEAMDRSPGVPVVVTTRTAVKMTQSFKKRGYSDEWIEAKIQRAEKNLAAAISKYPDRIHMADTTLWTTAPNEVMEGVFNFLGLDWRPEYLTMNALNTKRIPGSIISKPHGVGRQLQLLSAMTYSPTPNTKSTRFPTETPTYFPTMFPTQAPTTAPSISGMPSVSAMPSEFPSFTVAPSISSAPSDSPTMFPTQAPTTAPSISGMPSVSAMPSEFPSITVAPSISSAPSDSPTMFPTQAPSISGMPSVSAMPSEFPSITVAPSISSAPSDSALHSEAPSISVAPSISSAPSVSRIPSVSAMPLEQALDFELGDEANQV